MSNQEVLIQGNQQYFGTGPTGIQPSGLFSLSQSKLNSIYLRVSYTLQWESEKEQSTRVEEKSEKHVRIAVKSCFFKGNFLHNFAVKFGAINLTSL